MKISLTTFSSPYFMMTNWIPKSLFKFLYFSDTQNRFATGAGSLCGVASPNWGPVIGECVDFVHRAYLLIESRLSNLTQISMCTN